ncbi:hypothetical protein ABZW30_27760 [Kitasatospora sp. NPDC004669]|uniref:hypothetical protein n=1 Tax=Kitasatospora sp. NPDC004669 TaxID=3154555 RepID=UPI0033AC9C41
MPVASSSEVCGGQSACGRGRVVDGAAGRVRQNQFLQPSAAWGAEASAVAGMAEIGEDRVDPVTQGAQALELEVMAE